MLNALNAHLASHDAQAERWSIGTLIAILLRRLNIVVIAAAACVSLALVYLMLSEPHFTATATLIPDTRRAPPAPNEVVPESLSDPAIVENQIETIRSERIALMVVDRLELWKDPEFVNTGPGLISQALAMIGLGGPRRAADQDIMQRAAAGRFRTMLKVTRVGRSHLTEIAFTSRDAEKAAAIANEIADAYIRDQLNAKFSQADRSTQWMRQRIAELEGEVAAAERAIAEYKASHKLDDTAGGSPAILRQHEELAASLDKARAETARANVYLERAQAALRAEDRKALPDTGFLHSLEDDSVAALLAAYRDTLRATPLSLEDRGREPDDPAVVRRLAEQRDAIWNAVHSAAQAARKEVEAARLREAGIAQRINDLAPRALEARGHLDAIGELETRLESHRQIRDALQTRYARVSQFVQQQSLPVTEARVIAEATPPLNKSSPRTLLLLLLAASAGSVAGIGGALATEHFDRRVRRAEQIEEQLGLRPLGLVPSFSAARRKIVGGMKPRLPLGIDHWLSGPAEEVLRGVKIAVDGSVRPSGARILGVVSPNAGEGKTTVALALAVIAARGGRRTLLIDADIRDPSLTRALSPGGPVDLAAALEQQTPFIEGGIPHELGFDFLGQGSGVTHMHPSDLLASSAMQDMLEHLRNRYDTIIIDTPALLAHVDVVAAAGLFDCFVLIAEWGRTTTDDVIRSVSRSSALAERLVGALINKGPAA